MLCMEHSLAEVLRREPAGGQWPLMALALEVRTLLRLLCTLLQAAVL